MEIQLKKCYTTWMTKKQLILEILKLTDNVEKFQLQMEDRVWLKEYLIKLRKKNNEQE